MTNTSLADELQGMIDQQREFIENACELIQQCDDPRTVSAVVTKAKNELTELERKIFGFISKHEEWYQKNWVQSVGVDLTTYIGSLSGALIDLQVAAKDPETEEFAAAIQKLAQNSRAAATYVALQTDKNTVNGVREKGRALAIKRRKEESHETEVLKLYHELKSADFQGSITKTIADRLEISLRRVQQIIQKEKTKH
jgi:hypothetical protein